MTFKQALELKAHVRKGEQGSIIVYVDRIIRAETDSRLDGDRYSITFDLRSSCPLWGVRVGIGRAGFGAGSAF